MLKRARALAERAGICSSRSSREFSSGGGVRIVGKHAFDTKGKVLVLGVSTTLSPRCQCLDRSFWRTPYSMSLQVTSRQRCTFSKEGSEYLLSLDALSNASDRRSRAVLIGKSANGKHRSLISLQFPWCNATGLFQLLDMFESQVIIGGVEYRLASFLCLLNGRYYALVNFKERSTTGPSDTSSNAKVCLVAHS